MVAEPRTTRSDGDATRERIIEAAGALFAEQGFATTLNKTVAARAAVDIASINYHFGGRDGLYRAVLVAAHRRFIRFEDLAALTALDIPPPDKLRRLIELLIQGTSVGSGVGERDAQPSWHARVLSRELLSPTPHIDALHAEFQPKLMEVIAILAEVMGVEKQDSRLLPCMVSVGAPCAMLLLAGDTITPIASQIRQAPREALVEHLYTFAMGGLMAAAQRSTA